MRFYSKEDRAILQRSCAPLDYGPLRRAKQDLSNRFHFWDFDSDKVSHPLSLKQEQIVEILFLHDTFDPATFINWDIKRNPWFISRDWGTFS